MLLTNNDDGTVFTAEGNIGTSLSTKASNVRALGANNTREKCAVRQSQKSDVRHLLSMFKRVLDGFDSLVQAGLVTSFERPLGITLLGVLIVGNNLPLGLSCGGGLFGIVNTGLDSASLRSRCRGNSRLRRLLGLLDLDTERAQGTEEGTLLSDGVMVLQRDSDRTDNLSLRRLDLTLQSQSEKHKCILFF